MWCAGEVAACVKDPAGGMPRLVLAMTGMGEPPKVGKLYRVSQVTICEGCKKESLVFPGHPGPWHSECFRKVTKGSGDLFEQIKRSKPRTTPVRETEDA